MGLNRSIVGVRRDVGLTEVMGAMTMSVINVGKMPSAKRIKRVERKSSITKNLSVKGTIPIKPITSQTTTVGEDAIRKRIDECESNRDDFKRAKNTFNEGYYLGYKEALEWILSEKQVSCL